MSPNDQDDMNELSIHRVTAHQTLQTLSLRPFTLPDLETLATGFEDKIRCSIEENIILKGVCLCVDCINNNGCDQLSHEAHIYLIFCMIYNNPMTKCVYNKVAFNGLYLLFYSY